MEYEDLLKILENEVDTIYEIEYYNIILDNLSRLLSWMDYIKKIINEKLNKKPNDFEFIIKLSSIENNSNNPIKIINAKYNYMGEKKIYEDKDILNNGIGNNFNDFIDNIFHFNSFHYEKIKDSPEDLIYKCTIKHNNQEDMFLGANNFNYNLDKISKKINPNINQNLILNEKKIKY